MELETINKLYLELSQVATATTLREADLERMLNDKYKQHNETIQQLHALSDLIKSGKIDEALDLIHELTLPF